MLDHIHPLTEYSLERFMVPQHISILPKMTRLLGKTIFPKLSKSILHVGFAPVMSHVVEFFCVIKAKSRSQQGLMTSYKKEI